MQTGDADLLDALRHALGARWVRIVPQGAAVDAVARGIVRSRSLEVLRVDIPGSRPPSQIACALPRSPALEDTLIASAVAAQLSPPRPRPPRSTDALQRAMAHLAVAAGERPAAILTAALELTGSAAGAIAVHGTGASHALGPGRAATERAARDAAAGTTGRIDLAGRSFLALQLSWNGGPVAGLALEQAKPSPALDAFVVSASAALAATPSPPTATEGPDDLAAALAGFGTPALVVSDDGVLRAVSAEAEQLLGLAGDFDVGLPVAGRLRSEVLEAAAAGSAVSAGVVIGERAFDAAVVRLPSGGRLITLWDRSGHERLERIQEDLVSSVAHELRTPVAAVRGLIGLLRLRGSKLAPETMQQLLEDGEREIARLERLVEDILLAARISTGGLIPSMDDIDLRPIADDTVERTRERHPGHELVVRGEAAAHADPTLVRHALWHLVDNAAKYGSESGPVTVEITQGPEGAEVHVHDEGEGIFSGDIPALFSRFRQLDASSTRVKGGSGLGLFLVKELIEAQAGTVWVRSRLGRGSTFSFRLPPPQSE